MSSTRTECVSAPTEMKSAPVSAYAPTESRVMRPDTSTFAAPSRISTALRDLVGAHVVDEHDVDAGVARLGHLVERVALDLDDAASASGRGPARPPW